MDTLRQDTRFALRSLRKNLSVTTLAVLSLALAIAGNTVVFSFINGLLYRPLPYPEPERVVLIQEPEEGLAVSGVLPTSEPLYFDLVDQQRSFERLAAFRSRTVGLSTGDTAGEGEPVGAAWVTPNFFPLLAASAQRGRLFRPEEGIPGNQRVVVLTHGFWQERFGGDPGILQQTLELNGETYAVVGVLEEGFEFLDPSIRLWVPLALERGEGLRERRDLNLVARLADGVEEEQAEAEMQAFMTKLQQEHPEHRGHEIGVVNLRQEIPDARNRQLFAMLQGALLFVLLIACANLANLLLARGRQRTREIAVRASLGAGRRRILRQLLTESLILGGLGGLVGLGLGAVGIRILDAQMASFLPRIYAPVIDLRVVLFTAGVALLAGVLFGLAPAFQSLRFHLVAALKDGSRGAGRSRHWMGRALVVAEIALALVLLAGTGVMIQSFLALQNTDPGFETENLLTVQLSLPEAQFPEDEQVLATTEAIRERLAALPGVTSAAVSSSLPRVPLGGHDPYTVEGQTLPEAAAPPRSQWDIVSPEYLETVGITLLRGRGFDARDRADSEPVVLINQALADRHWPEGDPLGERITLRNETRRIVGVVAEVQHEIFRGQGRQPAMYVPWAQQPFRSAAYLLRTEGAPEELADPVRRAVQAVDSRLIVGQVQTLEQWTSQFFVGTRVFSVILGGFGMLALFLAMLGTYGVLAYMVAVRTHEIGVRMALGARRGQILRLMTVQGLKMALLGLLVGAPGVWAVSKLVESLLSDFGEVPFGSVVGVAVTLVAVTLVASLLPARRAASIQPVEALHLE